MKNKYLFVGDVQNKKYVMAAVKNNKKYVMLDVDKLERFINESFNNHEHKTNMILFSETSHDYNGILKYWTQGD